VLSVFTGCSERTSTAGGATFDVDNSRGFPVITARRPAERWQATPLHSIGAKEGGPVEFGSIRSILLDSAGTLIVVDARSRTLLEFDSTGALVRQIGRDGAGPGEYRSPYSIAWLGESLALLDPSNARIGVFRHDGGWITSWPVQPITGGQNIRLFRTPPGFSAFAFRRTASGSEGLYVRYEAGGPRDTVVLASRPTDLETGIECLRPDKAISFFTNPFVASFLQIPLGDGRQAVARTDAYRIAFLGREGDTTMVVAGDATPGPVSDAEWAPVVEELEKFRREWPTAQCNRTSFDRPAAKPVLNWLFLDGTGRLWVEVVTNEGTRYDIFDAAGHPVASVDGLPPTGEIDPSVAGGRAAFVVRDSSTDVPSIRVFRLAPSADARRP
jgi:hypothetical protein